MDKMNVGGSAKTDKHSPTVNGPAQLILTLLVHSIKFLLAPVLIWYWTNKLYGGDHAWLAFWIAVLLKMK